MSIKLELLAQLTDRLSKELAQIKQQTPEAERSALSEVGRWAFFVTTNEINELMDEVEKDTVYATTMNQQTVRAIRGGIGLWILNGVYVFPELQNETDHAKPLSQMDG